MLHDALVWKVIELNMRCFLSSSLRTSVALLNVHTRQTPTVDLSAFVRRLLPI
jgi:hypothetical protein